MNDGDSKRWKIGTQMRKILSIPIYMIAKEIYVSVKQDNPIVVTRKREYLPFHST